MFLEQNKHPVSGSLSEPYIRTDKNSDSFLPPLRVSPETTCVLSGKSRQYKPISSALYTSRGLYLSNYGSNIFFFKSSQTSLSTDKFSPQMLQYVMLCLTFQHDSHQQEQLHSSLLTARFNSSALSFENYSTDGYPLSSGSHDKPLK